MYVLVPVAQSLLPSTVAGLLGGLLSLWILAALVSVIPTRNHRGLSCVLAGADLVDSRNLDPTAAMQRDQPGEAGSCGTPRPQETQMIAEEIEDIIRAVNAAETENLRATSADMRQGVVLTLESALQSPGTSDVTGCRKQLELATYNLVDLSSVYEATGAQVIAVKNLATKMLPSGDVL